VKSVAFRPLNSPTNSPLSHLTVVAILSLAQAHRPAADAGAHRGVAEGLSGQDFLVRQQLDGVFLKLDGRLVRCYYYLLLRGACALLVSSRLILIRFVSPRLVSSHLVSSRFDSIHFVSSRLVSNHLDSIRFDSIRFDSIRFVSSHLVSSRLASSRLISSHLVSSLIVSSGELHTPRRFHPFLPSFL
jgi:hypothetical protein